jgi:hypothetical protein
MATSRRELLATGVAAALSYCLPRGLQAGTQSGGTSLRRSAAARSAVLADDPLLTRTVLSGQLRTAFAVEGSKGAKRLALQLVEVGDLPSAQSAGTVGSDWCFSALWSGPSSLPLAQRTYRLHHSQLGAFSVFLVPVGRPARVRYYQAVFNRPEA